MWECSPVGVGVGMCVVDVISPQNFVVVVVVVSTKYSQVFSAFVRRRAVEPTRQQNVLL